MYVEFTFIIQKSFFVTCVCINVQLMFNTRFSSCLLSCFSDDLPLLFVNLGLTDPVKWTASVPNVFFARGSQVACWHLDWLG